MGRFVDGRAVEIWDHFAGLLGRGDVAGVGNGEGVGVQPPGQDVYGVEGSYSISGMISDYLHRALSSRTPRSASSMKGCVDLFELAGPYAPGRYAAPQDRAVGRPGPSWITRHWLY
jgi:hypothetical protein